MDEPPDLVNPFSMPAQKNGCRPGQWLARLQGQHLSRAHGICCNSLDFRLGWKRTTGLSVEAGMARTTEAVLGGPLPRLH